MFRRLLRSTFLLVIAALALAPQARAGGPTDVTDVNLIVTLARTTQGADTFNVEVRVIGTNLNNGTLELPSAVGIQLPFTKEGDDLVIEDDGFSSEAEVFAVVTSGTYKLRLNNGTISSDISFTRPNVPSPDISQPGGGDVLAPGPIEVLFTACPICNQAGDSVLAELEGDAADEETLNSTSDSWIPQDVGGDLELPELSAFVTRVTHTAVRQSNPTINDSNNTVLFTSRLIQSDEVDFETGFHTPQGTFCLAANHPTPPAGCETLSDLALQLLDIGGDRTTQADGHDVEYSVVVEPSGKLTGTATADLDDNGSQETGPLPIKGKLGGSAGELTAKTSFSLTNEGLLAKLKVSVADTFSILGNQFARVQTASGSINGVRFQEESSTNGALPFPALGWVIVFDLDADGLVQNAVLTLEGGRNFPLTGTNKFNVSTGAANVKLVSNPKGISLSLKGVVLDDSVDPMAISGGNLSLKALGQKGQATLP